MGKKEETELGNGDIRRESEKMRRGKRGERGMLNRYIENSKEFDQLFLTVVCVREL